MSQQSLVRAAQRAAALVAAAVLASCANMLTGNDVTQTISTEVTAANAKTSEITVRIDPAMNGGTISAPGFKSVQKVGIPFNLSVDVGTNFAFRGWTVLGDGSLKIIDAAQPATSATIYKTAWKEPTVIQANFFRRPTLTINPINGGEVVNRNRKILLRFDHAMDPSTLLLPESVMVTENAMTNGAGWADVTKTYFSEILPNDKAGMEYYLAFASNGTLLKPYTYYKITVLKQAADTNGVTMVDDVVSQFSTGASADNSPPSITTYVGVSAATPDSNRTTTLFTNASTVYLSVTAIDDSGAVPTLTIQELFGSDPANPLKSRSNTMTTTAGYFEYQLSTAWGEGPRTVAVQGTDSIGNISAATEKNAQVLVFYDTTKPVISNFPLKGLTNSASQSLNLAASDTLGSGLASYVLTGDVVAGPIRQATEAGSAQLAFNLLPGDGPKKLTLTVTDKAGNTSEETKSLVLDTLAPQAPSSPSKILGRPDAFNASEASTQFRVAFAEDVQIGDTLSVVLNGKPLSVSTLGPTAVSERSQVLTVSAASLGNDGNLVLTSQVTDQAGNPGADSPSLTLLKDTAVPALALGSLSSSSAFDSSFARTGDQVSLTFTPADANLNATATVVLGGVSQEVPLVSGTPVTVHQVVGAMIDGKLDYAVTVSDAAGNISAASAGALGTVTIDNTAPSLELGTLGSSNASNGLFAKDGDTITLDFRLTEANLDPAKLTATFAGKAATITPLGGGNYKASLQVTTAWNDGTSYPVAYSLSAADKAGNSTSVNTGAVGTVTIDFSQPDFGLQSLVSSTYDSPRYFAKTGDTITMQFTATAKGSALTDVKGVIAGHDVAATVVADDLYEATYVMAATDDEGPVSYQIKASNQTGRVFTSNFTVLSKVIFDRTPPQVTVDSFLSSNSADPSHAYARLLPQADKLTLKFKASDLYLKTAEVGLAGVLNTVNGLTSDGISTVEVTPSVLPEGAVSYSVTVRDIAGNTTKITQSSPGVPQVIADNVAPVIKNVGITSSNQDKTWAKKDDVITVSFAVDDTNATLPVVKIANQPASVNSTGPGTYAATWTVKDNDTQEAVSFEIKATDRAGNFTLRTAADSGSVAIDTVAPVISLGSLVSNNTNSQYATKTNSATLTLTGADTHLSATGKVTLGGVEQTVNVTSNVSKSATQLLAAAPEGILTYTVTLTDLAGNTTSATSGATSMVIVDNVAPVLTWKNLASNNPTNTAFARNGDTVTLLFQVDDLHLTDAVTPFARADGTLAGNSVSALAVSSGLTASVSTTLAGLSPSDGLVLYTLVVKDLAGNIAVVPAPAADTVTIDNTPPVITMGTQTSDNAKNHPNSVWAKSGDTVTQLYKVTEKNTKTVAGKLANITVTPTDLGATGVADQRNFSLVHQVTAGDAQGATQYSVTVTDKAGNTVTVADGGAVGTITIDTRAPEVTVAAPSVTQVSHTGTVTFAVTTTDDNTIADRLTASLITLNANKATGAPTLPSAAKAVTSTQVTLTNCVGDGTLGITIQAGAKEDAAGNLSAASSASAPFKVDNTAPAFVVAPYMASPSAAHVKTGAPLTVAFSVSDQYGGSGLTVAPQVTFDCGAASATVNATFNGDTLQYEATSPAPGGVEDGDIFYTVVVKDTLLNTLTLANQLSRKLDNTKPTVSVTGVTTSGNPGYAKDGDTVTLTFTVTEASGVLAPGNPSVTIEDSAGTKTATATVSGTFPNFTAKYVTNSAALFSQGNLRYRIDVTDEALNGMTPVSAATSLLYDNIPVAVSGLTLSSNNSANTWAKAADIITLGFQASDTNWTAAGSSALIAGKNAVLDLSGAGKTAKLTVVTADTQGPAGFNLVLFDLAGNKTEVTTGALGTVAIDTVDPVLTLGSLASNNGNPAFAKNGNTLTLGFQADDLHLNRIDGSLAGHSVSKTTLSSGSADTLSAVLAGMTPAQDGLASYTLTVRDLAGNTATLAAGALGTVTIDNTLPVITMGTQTSNNAKSTALWAKAGDTVTQKFKVTEKNSPTITGTLAGSGSLTPTFLQVTGTDQKEYSIARQVLAGDAQGATAYSATATDQAGNSVTVTDTGAVGTITVDTRAPTVSVSAPSPTQASHTGAVTFTVSASDDNDITDHLSAGLVSLNANLASEALITPSATAAVTSTQVTLTNCVGDGTLGITILEGAKEDAAGNLSPASSPSASLKVDNTAPVVSGFTTTGPAAAYLKGGNSVTVKFTSSDPYGGTGIPAAPQVTFASGTASNTVNAVFNVDHYEASYIPSSAENSSGDILCTIVVKDALLNSVTEASIDSGRKLDNLKPTVTVLSAVTSGKPGYAKDGDTVTVSFQVDDNTDLLVAGAPWVTVKDSAATPHLGTATVTGTYPNYTATYTLRSEDTFDQGNLKYRIDVTDVAGNAMDPVSADSLICYDNIPPLVTGLTLVSNNAAGTWAKATNTITLGFEAGDTNWTMADSSASLAGREATLDLGPAAKTAKITVVAGDAQGAVGYSFDLYDLAGNQTHVVSGAVGSVTIDTVDPVLTLGSLASNNGNPAFAKNGNTLTLGFQADDLHLDRIDGSLAGHSVSKTTLSSGAADTLSALLTGMTPAQDGLASYTLTVKDLAGNSATLAAGASGTVTIDNTLPVITMGTQTSNNAKSTALWAKAGDTVTQKFKVTEKNSPTITGTLAGSGSLTATFLQVTGTDQKEYSIARQVLAGDAQGATAYSATATDQAGNSVTVTNTGAVGTITVDTEAPTVSISDPSRTWTNSVNPVTYDLTYHDDQPVGSTSNNVGLITVTTTGTVDDVVASLSGVNQVKLLGATLEGSVTISVQAGFYTDSAGNASTAAGPATVCGIDNTLPELTLGSLASNNANPAFAKNGNTLTLGFQADDLHLDRIDGSLAGHSVSKTTLSSGAADTLSALLTGMTPAQDGLASYTLTVKDLAGNSATLAAGASGTVTIDNTLPVITMGTQTSSNDKSTTLWAKAGDTVTQKFKVTEKNSSSITGTLAGSGSLTPTFLQDTGTDQKEYSIARQVLAGDAQGATAYSATATDQAGNSFTVTNSGAVGTITVDTVKPVVSITGPTYPDGLTAVFTVTTTELTAAYDLKVDNLNLSESVTPVITNGTTISATVTFAKPSNSGSISFSVNAGTVADSAGNLNATTGDSLAAAYNGTKFAGYQPPGGFLAGERTLPGSKPRVAVPVSAPAPAPTIWTMVSDTFSPPPSFDTFPVAPAATKASVETVAYPVAWVTAPVSTVVVPQTQTPVPDPVVVAEVPSPVPAPTPPTIAPAAAASSTPAPVIPAPSAPPVPTPAAATAPVASAPSPSAPTSPVPLPVPERTPSGYPPLWNQTVEPRKRKDELA